MNERYMIIIFLMFDASDKDDVIQANLDFRFKE